MQAPACLKVTSRHWTTWQRSLGWRHTHLRHASAGLAVVKDVFVIAPCCSFATPHCLHLLPLHTAKNYLEFQRQLLLSLLILHSVLQCLATARNTKWWSAQQVIYTIIKMDISVAHDPSCMYISARHMQEAERHIYKLFLMSNPKIHSSGAVWESRWTSWAVRPNEPSGFRGRKDLLHRASALVTTCP